MKTAAIIAEYNPFHNGHFYQLNTLKQNYDIDRIIVLMSGDVVQRGTPAIISKFTRTRHALLGGADLVLELPAAVALGHAGIFAGGSIALIKNLPVDYLCFGSETTDLTLLEKIAFLFANEPDTYRSMLSNLLSTGLSYPVARARAAAQYMSSEQNHYDQTAITDILEGSNNILAISYLEAMIRQNCNITPIAIKREGNLYRDETISSLASATAIRSALYRSESDISQIRQAVPDFVYDDLMKCQSNHLLRSEDDFTTMLRYALLSHTESSLSSYTDNKDLIRRLLKESESFTSISELSMRLKHKAINYTSISRLLFRILLQIDHESTQRALSDEGQFLRVLGMKKDAGDLIKQIRRDTNLPIVMQLAKDEDHLQSSAQSVLHTNLRATEICRITDEIRFGQTIQNEYRTPLIFL